MSKPSLPIDLDQRIANAHVRGHYAPSLLVLDFALEILSYTKTPRGYPFVLLNSLPADLHDYIQTKARGSAIPLLDSGEEAYWTYDIQRWLEAVGITIKAVPTLHHDMLSM